MILQIVDQPVPLKIDESGAIRVGKTRVALDSLVYAFNDGATAEQIVDDYPAVDLADVYATISYYLKHRQAVEEYLHHRRERAESTREQVDSIVVSAGVRERLLARRIKKDQSGAAGGRR